MSIVVLKNLTFLEDTSLQGNTVSLENMVSLEDIALLGQNRVFPLVFPMLFPKVFPKDMASVENSTEE